MFLFTKRAVPSAPVVNKILAFFDTTDRRFKTIDDNGLISIMNNDGLQDRNIITNGGFSIQQRVATASTAIPGISTTTRGGQVADTFAVTTSVASNLNWAQIDSGGAPESGLNSRYYGSIISASAGKKVMISQWILNAEMAHLRGQKVRCSVKLNQKVGSAGQIYKLGLIYLNASGTIDTSPAFLSGAWSATGGTDPAWGTNLLPITPDAAPIGENGTITGNYLNIAGQATTWVRSSCVFSIPSTARNLAMVLFADATGGSTDNLSVAEFQMTQGPDIVDYVEPPQAETLTRCLRRFCKSFPLTIVPAASVTLANGGYGATGRQEIAGSGTALGIHIEIKFPIPMWKAPQTVTLFTPVGAGAVVYRHEGPTPAVQGATAVMTNSTTTNGCVVSATNEASTNGVVGNLCSVHYIADAENVA